VVAKALTKRVRWLQLRRTTCGCGEDFVYLAHGGATAEVQGMNWISLLQSDKGFHDKADEKLRDKLRAVEGAKHAGRGRCPHCARYQLWMWIPRAGVKNALYGLILGLIVGMVLASQISIPRGSYGLAALLGSLGGAALGYWLSIRGWVSASQRDPASLTLEDFATLQAEAREQGVQPELLVAQRVARGPLAHSEALEVLSARLAPGGGFE
jgi:hypothetical protein